MIKMILLVATVIILASPFIVSADITPLVPCGTSYAPQPCTICHLFELTQKILNFLAWIIAPTIAVLVIAVGGFKMLTSGAKPELRREGLNAIKIAITGMVIVFGAWAIINETLLFFTSEKSAEGEAKFRITDLKMPWNKIECVVPEAVFAPVVPTITAFNNVSSPELTTLISCVSGRVSDLNITSITDNNIGSGLCDPTDKSESFSDPNNCQHAQYSCHYGGRNCASRGSFAFDFGTQAGNPPYTDVQSAVLQCNSDAFVQEEFNPPHGHASIGSANGCGCD